MTNPLSKNPVFLIVNPETVTELVLAIIIPAPKPEPSMIVVSAEAPVRLMLFPITTFSAYTPLETMMVSPGLAASIAP